MFWIISIVVLFILAACILVFGALVGADPDGRGADFFTLALRVSGGIAVIAVCLWVWRAIVFFGATS